MWSHRGSGYLLLAAGFTSSWDNPSRICSSIHQQHSRGCVKDAVWLASTREQESVPTAAPTLVAYRSHLGQEMPAGTLLSCSGLEGLEEHLIQGKE